MTLTDLFIYLLALIGLKSVIFGQYWPWQKKGK